MHIEGVILDADYLDIGARSTIRLTVKQGSNVYPIFDKEFRPYFYLAPGNDSVSEKSIGTFSTYDKNGTKVEVYKVEKDEKFISGKKTRVFRIYANAAREIPVLKSYMQELGVCYEYDILFWKRYLIDKNLSPLFGISAEVHDENGMRMIDKIERKELEMPQLSHICFDIETYNPKNIPNPDKDPAIMISYANDNIKGVITPKRINKDFVEQVKNEKEMLERFNEIIKKNDFDIISGYNSSNFDIPYLLKRAEKNNANFRIGRYDEDVYTQHHGLVESTKIPGRIHADIFNVAKFVAVVGTAEYLIKVNRFTLGEVYKAITGNAKKKMVNKTTIYQMWDKENSETEDLADYSLDDSLTLDELYRFFMPLEFELSRLCGTTLSETMISTTGQLVEYLLMLYAHKNNELIPNKPDEHEIQNRMSVPYEGAYVKTPSAGVYGNMAVLDFRGLYPSIIIAYNIDPSTMAEPKSINEAGFNDTPIGIKFKKEPQGIIPAILKILISERQSVKKAYKASPDNKSLGARSQALKILANSFYGYLGYARSRWYSRECATSVTALGRDYIKNVIEEAEKAGFGALYGDTDSVFLLMNNKTKDDVKEFLKQVNTSLPESMELELEDFYTRGVFVGKKSGTGEVGVKKKYALLSESGRIKIRGFELVRRDWSNIARDTQRKVLEAILKEGSKESAVKLVKKTINDLREGKVNLNELVIHTQLRKGIDNYDITSPELSAAKKAIARGKDRSDIENLTIGYIITKNGKTISEKAELEEFAKDYDAEYYIDHQVIPSTLKILKELGVSKEELTGEGTQKRL